MYELANSTVVGASGDNADFQFIERKWKKKVIEGAYMTIVMTVLPNQFTLGLQEFILQTNKIKSYFKSNGCCMKARISLCLLSSCLPCLYEKGKGKVFVK